MSLIEAILTGEIPHIIKNIPGCSWASWVPKVNHIRCVLSEVKRILGKVR